MSFLAAPSSNSKVVTFSVGVCREGQGVGGGQGGRERWEWGCVREQSVGESKTHQ